MAKRDTTPVIETEHAERIGRYIEAYRRLCRKSLARVYKDATLALVEWQNFNAQFGEGGDFEGLDAQFASDAVASGIDAQTITALQDGLATFVATMLALEIGSPGLFGIQLPPPEPEPEPEPEPDPEPEA